jgi:hypothetical protein
MKETKVLIFHTGYSDYLKYNCEITSQTNKIILIGDEEVKSLSKINNVDFVNFKNYLENDEIKYLKSYFKPYNSTDEKYVWLWYLRVFITKLFMEENQIQNIFHIDSDNILFENINNLAFSEDNAYLVSNNFDNPFHMTASIHSSLLNTNFFNEFVKLYDDIFISKNKFHLIEEKIKYHQTTGSGGICDMTLFYLLEKLELVKVQNLMLPILSLDNEKFIFMNDINDPEGYHQKKQYKMNYKGLIKTYKNKKNSNVSIFDRYDENFINVANIHYQGKAKRFLNQQALNKFTVSSS